MSENAVPKPSKFDLVVLDCPDALVLGGGYAEVLGWEVEVGSDANWATLVPPDGGLCARQPRRPDGAGVPAHRRLRPAHLARRSAPPAVPPGPLGGRHRGCVLCRSLLRRRPLEAAPGSAGSRGGRDSLRSLAPAGGGRAGAQAVPGGATHARSGGDPSGLTYNLNQSITAVGSGGLTGRGPTEASQTRLDYLPEHATDFAFASLAEQRGFVGSAILLLLYLLVVWRGLRVITVASDLYGAVVAGGLIFALVFQVFVNVGMTMGVAPVTGIPLPFVTVGGSSMVANLLMIGILQSIHARGVLGGRPLP